MAGRKAAAKGGAKKTVRRAVSYRKASFHSYDEAPTLEELLGQLKVLRPKIHDRKEAMDAQGSELRYISHWKSEHDGFYGRLSIVHKNRMPNALRDDSDAETIPLTEFAPPTGHDYAPSATHFLVVKNHVVMTQSTLLKTSSLEAHLAYLLRAAGLLTTEQGLSLIDEPQKATKERVRKTHVKSVMLGRPVLESFVPEVAPPKGKKTKFKAAAAGPIPAFIRDWLGQERFANLGLMEGVFSSNLEVWIEFRYPKHSRTQDKSSVKLLDDLSLALRDVDGEEVRLSLTDGSTVTGKELKISGFVEVEGKGKGPSFDENDLYIQMLDCLNLWIKNSIVTP